MNILLTILNYLLQNFIAVISLVISTTVLYIEYVRSFRVVIYDGGRVQIAKNPFSEDLRQPAVFLDMIISNRGARAGVVEDIALILKKNSETEIFRSLLEVTDRTKSFQGELKPPQAETFIGFELRKGETKIKQILFVPHENSSDFSFQTGEFNVDLWATTSKTKKWAKYNSVGFTISSEDIRVLDDSTITPQPGGGYFVKWMTQDKPTERSEKRLNDLKTHL